MNLNAKGLSQTKDYRIWWDMLERCRNSNRKDYYRYGGRGIRVCKRWKHSFLKFVDDMGRKPEGMTLERVNNNGKYTPSNCRWSTRLEQNRNRCSNRMLKFRGLTYCIAEWAGILGISKDTIATRLRRGWSVERALSPHVQSVLKQD